MNIADVLRKLESIKANSKCYEARIEKLRQMGRNPQLIQDGIADVLQVLNSGARSFVVYGEPQSGKTEFMIALVCKLLDMGKQTIFVVMNDNTELEAQNFDRFHKAQELNPTPELWTQVVNAEPAELRPGKQRVIFCRKNSKNLQRLVEACRFMEDRVVIDDEADYATPNAKINREELTAINENVGKLGDLEVSGGGAYIGVTATPARLDLNNTFLNESKNWVFLNSHEFYKGRQFFFPLTADEVAKSDYQLVKLPDDTDDPRLLRHAVFRFLIRVAILNSPQGSDPTAYSMLIHTGGTINDHEKDHKDVTKIIKVLRDQSHSKFKNYVDEIGRIAGKLTQLHRADVTPEDIVLFILQYIGKSEVLTINSKNDSNNVKRAGNPQALFTFAVGGNIVSRGLTFENLLTFFFSRTVKNRLQQNTYIQRARMFGNRPYSKYFELCVPDTLFSDWATVFQDHEISLRLGRAGVYQHVQSDKTSVADRGAIDKKSVSMEKSERPTGEIFRLSSALEEELLAHDGNNSISFIERLIESSLIKTTSFPISLIKYLREVARPDESDVLIVFRSVQDQNVIQTIDSYKDGNSETITRPRGGIIHAMLNKRREYAENTHFILPIKNDKGEARFLYKSNIGQVILQNLKFHSPMG